MMIQWLVDNMMNIGEFQGKWDLCKKFDYYYSTYYPYLEYNNIKISEEEMLEHMLCNYEYYVNDNELDIDCNDIDFSDEQFTNYCKQHEYMMLEYFDSIAYDLGIKI